MRTLPSSPTLQARPGVLTAAGMPAVPVLGLVFALLAAMPCSPALAIVGGDPGLAIYYPEDGQEVVGQPSLAISAAGVQFAAIARGGISVDDEIVVLRSDDGGASWSEWSVLTAPPGDDLSLPELQVAAGVNNEWVYLSYVEDGDDIYVARTLATQAAASWSSQLVDSPGGAAGAYPRIGKPELATRPSATDPVDVAVAYWIETDFEDYELHYSVSLNGGAAFQPVVVPYDQPPPVDGYWTMSVDLALGDAGAVHLAAVRRIDLTDAVTWKLNYLSAVNDGATLADWSTTAQLLDTSSDETLRLDGVSIAADPYSDDVVLGYTGEVAPSYGLKILASFDGGASWVPAAIEDPGSKQGPRMFWTAVGPVALANEWTGGVYLLRPDSGPTGTYESELFLRTEHLIYEPGCLATDPTQGNEFAVVGAFDFTSSQEVAVWFNAAWRNAAGYGVLETGGVHSLGGSTTRFVAPPAVGDLDGDGLAEIVVPGNLGSLYSYDATGNLNGTYAMGDASAASVPVLFDFDGDGDREVVVGTPDGRVHLLDGALVPLVPRPFIMDDSDDVFVSAGPVTGWSPGEIVAACYDRVHVLNLNGSEMPGWPQVAPSGTVVGRAAIGDVDADGEVEVVAAFTTGVVIIGGDGGIERQVHFAVPAPSGGVALADLDGNGDLEIAIPRANGSVALVNHDGTSFGAGWPFVSGTGSPVTGVSIANVLNAGAPTLCFSTVSGGVFAVDTAGLALPGYPAFIAAGDSSAGEPIVARVANPGTTRPQLLMGTRHGVLHQWTAQGNEPLDWPHRFGANAPLSPVVADVDNDGIAELVVTVDASIYVLDTGTAPLPDPVRSWRMTGHDLARSGCADCLPGTPTAAPPAGGAPGGDGVAGGDGLGSGARIEFAGASPNPAPGRTGFWFTLPADASVSLAVFDVRGRRVRELGRHSLAAGAHQIDWDGRDDRGSAVASGGYFARLEVSAAGGVMRNVLVRELMVQR